MADRIVVAKIGLDGHEVGAKLIAVMLREAGYEVIYLGMRQTVKTVVATALQEDVSLIGISLLSGVHLEIASDLFDELKRRGLTIPVIFGGIIPPQDVPELRKLGVVGAFGPGSARKLVVDSVAEILANSRNERSETAEFKSESAGVRKSQ